MNTLSDKRKKGIFRLFEIAGPKKWWLLGSMLLAVIATTAQFIPVVCVYLITQELAAHAGDISGADRQMLFNLGFISLVAVASFGILLYTAMMLSHIAAFNILYLIRINIAEKLPRLSMGFFSRKSSGEIKKVAGEDVERIELFVAHHIPDITSAIVFPLIVIIFLFAMDWRLALAALIPLPMAFTVMAGMMTASGRELQRKYHDALEKMNAAVVEYVRGMPVIKIFGAAAESFRSLKESVISYRDFSQSIARDYSRVYPAFLTAASSSLLFILPLSLFLLDRPGAEAGFIPTVLLFLLVGGGFFFPLLKLMFISGYLAQIKFGVERIDAVLYMDELPETDLDEIPRGFSVEFSDVSFSYEARETLRNISFQAGAGTVTALVGPSGAGKTTLGLLSARFWDVTSGAIKIGGVDIRNMKTSRLMEYISFVFQDEFLFFDTLEENIRMGNTAATKDDVIAAAVAAQCHEFIQALPEGYSTLVGEGGTYLSGGEVQRIGIARAILKDAPIIILDEATAYADPENEGKILAALARLIEGKTVIIIAHRLSTITSADKIIVIDRGSIAESGTHVELLDAGGLYHSMFKTYTRAREWVIDKGVQSS